MDPERTPGAAFAPADIGWLDFETKSSTDIKAGTYRYATGDDTAAVVLAYAIGDDDINTIDNHSRRIAWTHTSKQLRDHHARVLRGEAIWAAWNAGFDKAIWNYATADFPELEPHHIIDIMAQATAAGLPPDLDQAAQQAGVAYQKDKAGKALLKLFCYPGATATATTHPKEWGQLLRYAGGDIAAMRAVAKVTAQLTRAEWAEYWAMERINARGVFIDQKMVEHAATLAADDRIRSRQELAQLTGGVITSVDQVARITKWLLERLPPAGRQILTERAEEIDDDGVITRPAEFALTRGQVERLIAYVEDLGYRPDMHDLLRVLQIRLYGGSKTPAKFGKMLAQQVDGVLHGQYVFNGAAQTGRASSKGVQIHNLARDTLRYEHDAIEALLNGELYDGFARLGDDSPVSRKLSLLIRPAFVPGGDRMFVWSDWSQIEARILPWLVGDVEGAENRLNIFRAVDQDKRVPDIYTRSAADISHLPIELVTKALRQRGKVAELALGFGGGVNALHAMGAGYGLHLSDEEAKTIVDRWRASNPWCVRFWNDLITAVESAMQDPGTFYFAGRVAYRYYPGYLGGSLICVLPSLRCLTYRAIRYDRVDVLDKDDKPTGKTTIKLRFSRGYGRVNLWHGMFCENIVQAVAADCLRGTLRRLEDEGFYTRLHTHDECVIECAEANAEHYAERLREVMQRGFPWSEGLPLMSEETISPYYTKVEQ